MIVMFVGHGTMTVPQELQEQIKMCIKSSVKDDRTAFYCGGYGAFDLACAHIARELRDDHPHIRTVFVTPYMDENRLRDIRESLLYDEILYPPLETVPPRFAIVRRNEYMVNKADLIIAYVAYARGGAYRTLRYAEKKQKHIINLANLGR